MREPGGGGGEKRADVVHQVRGVRRLLDDPPYEKRDSCPCEHRLQFHCRLLEAQTSPPVNFSLILARTPAWMGVTPTVLATLVLPPAVCPDPPGAAHTPGHEYAAQDARTVPVRRASARSAAFVPIDLTTLPCAGHAWGMAMPEASETDFAIIVFREDDRWDAGVLPVAVTSDLAAFIRVLRQQPSIAGTIGLAGIDDYFFVAVRVIGSQVSVLLSDIGAALDYPLARQVLDFLDIPVPDEEDIDQVLPAGDLSIFADLGLDEMELAAICSRLDLDSDDPPDSVEDAMESIAARLGFGQAMERALDLALGP